MPSSTALAATSEGKLTRIDAIAVLRMHILLSNCHCSEQSTLDAALTCGRVCFIKQRNFGILFMYSKYSKYALIVTLVRNMMFASYDGVTSLQASCSGS